MTLMSVARGPGPVQPKPTSCVGGGRKGRKNVEQGERSASEARLPGTCPRAAVCAPAVRMPPSSVVRAWPAPSVGDAGGREGRGEGAQRCKNAHAFLACAPPREPASTPPSPFPPPPPLPPSFHTHQVVGEDEVDVRHVGRPRARFGRRARARRRLGHRAGGARDGRQGGGDGEDSREPHLLWCRGGRGAQARFLRESERNKNTLVFFLFTSPNSLSSPQHTHASLTHTNEKMGGKRGKREIGGVARAKNCLSV